MCKTLLTYSDISGYLIFIYLANFKNKLLFCWLTLWWQETNLIGRSFLVGSRGLFSLQKEQREQNESVVEFEV